MNSMKKSNVFKLESEKHLEEETKRLRKLLDVALEEGESDKEIALQIQEFSEDQNLLFVLWRKGEEHLRNGVLRQMLFKVHQTRESSVVFFFFWSFTIERKSQLLSLD